MALLERAIEISSQAHKGQIDKAGAPYILHPLRVMLAMETETERIVAVLHDVVEDSNSKWTFEKLSQEGFSDEIISSLKLLTHEKNEDYFDYINNIKTSPLAVKIKLADLQDNLDITRLSNVDDATIKRLRKYHEAFIMLI